MNDTEIKHGVHIVAEILEGIVESNLMHLKVAEIEGDAVFFYRVGEKPRASDIQKQIKAIYNGFHKLIKTYKRDRVCSCGACSTVHNLQLKFVSHYGKTIERNIANYKQLMGADVTLVHKLLKNNIDEHEYFLWSEGVLSNESDTADEWKTIHSGSMYYDGIGNVNYNYISLATLRDKVPEIEPRKEIETVDKPIIFSLTINANYKYVYETLIDSSQKSKWLRGVTNIKFNEERIHRIGSSHECIIPVGNILFETLEDYEDNDKRIYTEFSNGSFLSPPFYENYIIEKQDDEVTHLQVALHMHGKGIQKLLQKPIAKAFKKAMFRFKNICEGKALTLQRP